MHLYKRILFSLKASLFVVGVLISQAINAQGFEKGLHYTVIKGAEVSEKKEVVEYFSFSCPGCFAFEPNMKALIKQRPEVNLRRVHLPFGGSKAKFSQKVFAVMQLLDAQNHKDATFNRIHIKRDTFDSDAEVISFFEELGYESKLIEGHLKSFTADSLIRKMNSEAAKKQVKSVPTIIVNGKYKVENRSLNSSDQFLAVVSFLYSLEG